MPEPGARLSLNALLGAIRRGVNERDSTTELWARVRAAAHAQGYSDVTGDALTLGRLRSQAAAIRNAASQFGAAAPGDTITASMFAPDMSVSQLPAIQTIPRYRVRFTHFTTTAAGVDIATSRVHTIPVQLPGTKAELLAELAAAAAVMAEQYGEQHQGIGDIEITVV